ncbi:unnamed protein product [Amoebophrya sp. A25]|nr:unnamed protein product [Amoebophrya sp. A25]|eukprot:GSA25T00026609001.1
MLNQLREGQPKGPTVRVRQLHENQEVHCFHRYCQDPNGNYFMVDHKTMGSLHPSMGRTDGWTRGVVVQAWAVQNYDPAVQESWPLIRWTHPLWYDRRGRRLDTSQVGHVTQRIPAEQIRTLDEAEEAVQRPILSVLSVRWGGNQAVDPVTEGVGGWGAIGSTCSDNYINSFESQIFNTVGPQYEIFSCFIQNSSELQKLKSPLIRHQLRGKYVGAQYYLWPIGFDDGHDYPGYVEREELFNLIMYQECAGIPTRFPHNSHLYRFFASKEWTAAQCLNPALRTPLTTKVPRSLIAQNPERAAAQAIDALNAMATARTNVFQFPDYPRVKPVTQGVAKLGWSWEALDVRKWTDLQTLQTGLVDLGEQQGSHMEYVFVQEWVEFDIEIRNYVVMPDLRDPGTCLPKGAVCTMFCEETAHGGFTNFNRFSREECLTRIFKGDQQAYDSCTTQINALIYKWLFAIRAECAEPPVFVRFDMLCKYRGNGVCEVSTGELTELGGCFLGWNDGPQTVFAAVIDSYFGRLAQNCVTNSNGQQLKPGIPMGGLVSNHAPSNQVALPPAEQRALEQQAMEQQQGGAQPNANMEQQQPPQQNAAPPPANGFHAAPPPQQQ